MAPRPTTPGTDSTTLLSSRQPWAWVDELRRIVKPTGSIWIHSTYHNSGFVNVACQILGLEIINEVVWFKRNAFPKSGRSTPDGEPRDGYLWSNTWISEGRRVPLNYQRCQSCGVRGDNLKAANKQLRTVWDIPNNKSRDERAYGSHPTQKPLRLTERLFMIAGTPGGKVLVPFLGSGTEAVAATRHGMDCLGDEVEPEYFDLACRRLKEELSLPQLIEPS